MVAPLSLRPTRIDLMIGYKCVFFRGEPLLQCFVAKQKRRGNYPLLKIPVFFQGIFWKTWFSMVNTSFSSKGST